MRIALEKRNAARRGNAIVEFALSATVLFTMLFGTFQFGYTFYVYNQLQAAIRSGIRYASMRPYTLGGGASCPGKVQLAVKNVVVFGEPNPTGSVHPIVKGLATSRIDVAYVFDAAGVPTNVTVQVNSFTVDAVVTTFTFTNKPYATVPFFGRYAPAENCP